MPIYLKVDGIKGEAEETNHKEWITVLSVSSPLERKIPDGATGIDRVQKGSLMFGNIELHRGLDSSSVPLAREACLGKVHPTMELHVTASIGGEGEKNQVEYKLSNCLVASHSMSVASHDGGHQDLHDNLSLNFTKIEWKYTTYDPKTGKPKGVVTGWYDRSTRTGG